jgi:hypothetical protein
MHLCAPAVGSIVFLLVFATRLTRTAPPNPSPATLAPRPCHPFALRPLHPPQGLVSIELFEETIAPGGAGGLSDGLPTPMALTPAGGSGL